MSQDVRPRVVPIPISNWNDEILDALGSFPAGLKFVMQEYAAGDEQPRGSNVLGALARHPELAKAFLVFNAYIATRSSLPPRIRELVILRISWLRHSKYEFSHHLILGSRYGLTGEEMRQLKSETLPGQWKAEDECIVRAVDELDRHARITDETWTALSKHFEEKQILDLLFLTGAYATLAMALNSIDLPLEPSMPPLSSEVI